MSIAAAAVRKTGARTRLNLGILTPPDLIISEHRQDQYMCDNDLKKLLDSLDQRKKVINPFPLLSLIDDPTYHKINAEIFNMRNKIGTIMKEAFADLIVLKKNPINDINVFNNIDKNLMLIIKDGEIIKNSFS